MSKHEDQQAKLLEGRDFNNMMNEWTRNDLPTVDDAAETYMTKGVYSVQEGIALVLDAVVTHLNENDRLPTCGETIDALNRNRDELVENRDQSISSLQRLLADTEAERDQAREARDEARHEWSMWRDQADRRVKQLVGVERERDDWRDKAYSASEGMRKAVSRAEAAENRHTWPKVTPTGHTYVEPGTYGALCHEHDNAAQAAVESWEADECPPEPTWEMVGIAHREVERIQRERDQWEACAGKWHGAWRKSAPVRTVTRDEVEKAISELRTFPRFLTDELLVLRDEAIDAAWALVSGETEPADPVEKKARELWDVARPSDDVMWRELTSEAQQEYRRIAEHVLWQEDRHVDQ